MKGWILIALWVACALPTLASADSSRTSDQRYFRINYANDFFNATDRYYTQGVRFDYTAPFISRSPLSKILIRSGTKATNAHGIFFMQECYTPISIRRDTVQTGERPFAAVMYLGEQLVSLDIERKQRVSSEIQLGVVGPCAGAGKRR